MKNYTIKMTTTFCIKAKNEEEAEEKAGERCAEDTEILMPGNMEVTTKENTTLPDNFFTE